MDQVDINAICEYGEERFLTKSNRNCVLAGIEPHWCAGCVYRSPVSRGKLGRWASPR